MSPRTLSSSGKLYVYAVIVAGSCTITASAFQLVRSPRGYQWLILAALTIFSGSATVKLPSIPASLSVSETFVFTSVLLFGAPVGTLIVALDGLIISLWLSPRRKEFHRVLFNMCAPAVAIWVSAQTFFWLADIKPLILQHTAVSISEFLLPLVAFTILYFLLNSWLIAFAVSFETNSSSITIWRTNFAWLSLNFFCGASVATFFTFFLTTVQPRKIDSTFLTFLGAILPLLLVLYLTYRTSMERVDDANRHLSEMNQMYLATIETLALAIDAKDQVTHGHIRRVQSFAVELTRALAGSDRGLLRAMEAASLLHDMGKLAVPEHILNKPGKLTTAEFDRMKLHASIGADILSSIQFPYPVIPIVRHHHENWDGSGYPDGLSGTEIPLGARILSVIDCYDALTSDRPYRPRLTREQAISILVQRRGVMYDPLIVDAFVNRLTDGSQDDEGAVTANAALLELARQIAQNAQSGPALRARANSPQCSTAYLRLCVTIGSATTAATVSDAMAMIAPQILSSIPADLFLVFAYDQSGDDMAVTYALGAAQRELQSFKVRLGERLAGWVGATRQSALNGSPALDLDPSVFPSCEGLQSCLMVPLTVDGVLAGTVGFYSLTPARYTTGDQQFAELLSGHLGSLLVELTRASLRSGNDIAHRSLAAS